MNNTWILFKVDLYFYHTLLRYPCNIYLVKLITVDININLISLNTNELGEKLKRNTVLKNLKEFNYDIYFLQETHITAKSEKLLKMKGRVI